uniref:Uncharacterized protein n=1 Tax=Eutreptiella gymnastica TaxID=73025 RepID=A0A7S4FTZ9_9EUGL
MSKAPSSQQMVVGEAWAIDTRVRQMSAGRWSLDSPVVAQEGKGGGTKPSEITALLASIDFSPLTKIHQAAVLTHRFCSSMVAGRGTNTSTKASTRMVYSHSSQEGAAVMNAVQAW